jgi:hypothetical protein
VTCSCENMSTSPIHATSWRNCLENRDSLQFAAPSVGNGGREAPFRSPVPSNIHHRETRQLFSKQFRKVNSRKFAPGFRTRLQTMALYFVVERDNPPGKRVGKEKTLCRTSCPW